MLKHPISPKELFFIVSGVHLLLCQVIWTSSKWASIFFVSVFPAASFSRVSCAFAFLHHGLISCAPRKQACGDVCRETTMRQQQKCLAALLVCLYIRAPPGYSSLSAQRTHNTQRCALRFCLQHAPLTFLCKQFARARGGTALQDFALLLLFSRAITIFSRGARTGASCNLHSANERPVLHMCGGGGWNFSLTPPCARLSCCERSRRK